MTITSFIRRKTSGSSNRTAPTVDRPGDGELEQPDDSERGILHRFGPAETDRSAALASEASGQRGNSISARAGHSPELGSSARELPQAPRNDLQKASSAYRLPASDLDFMWSESMQGVRFLLEFAKAEEQLRRWGIRTTIVVFGSARARQADGSDRATPRMAQWYEQARCFGRIASERGGALHPVDGQRHNVIATGGGPGIMEAANRGAADVGAPSVGLNIHLSCEQEPNPYSTPDLTFQFHSFAMRKMHFELRAAAVVAFPGGFGTFDELFEIVTLVQTRKARSIPIVCVDRSYWSRVLNLEALLDEGMISPADLQLIRFADDAEGAWRELQAAGIDARRPADEAVAVETETHQRMPSAGSPFEPGRAFGTARPN
jgi:uncharacterized protein (TIGR00730 family)